MVASFREHSSRVSEVGNRLEMGSIKGSVKSHVGLRCTEGLGVSCIYVLSHSVVSDSVRPHGLYVAHQAPLPTGFSRQEYSSGLPLPPPGDFPDSRIKPKSLVSPALQADALLAEPLGKPKVLVARSCPTLGDSMDCSPPGSSVHRILQTRILEQVAIAFSSGSSQPRDQTRVLCIAGRFFAI